MRSPSRLMAGGASIALAIAVMNLATYASTVLAARLLGPREYGGFAAFTGLLLVARRAHARAADRRRAPGRLRPRAGRPDRGDAAARHLPLRLGAGRGLRPADPGLRDRARPAQLGDGGAGRARGVADDGRRRASRASSRASDGGSRWRWSTSAWASRAWPRPCCCSGSRPRPWPRSACSSASLVPALVGWWALRSGADRRAPSGTGDHSGAAVLREVGTNSHVLLAFLALSNADVILVRARPRQPRRRALRRRPHPGQEPAVPAPVRHRGGLPLAVDRPRPSYGADAERRAGRSASAPSARWRRGR